MRWGASRSPSEIGSWRCYRSRQQQCVCPSILRTRYRSRLNFHRMPMTGVSFPSSRPTMTNNEFLQANTEAVAALEKRLQIVQQILEEIANEIGWLARNIQDWSIGDSQARTETVECMECSCE